MLTQRAFIVVILLIVATLASQASASWLDKLKDASESVGNTAKDMTEKAEETFNAVKENIGNSADKPENTKQAKEQQTSVNSKSTSTTTSRPEPSASSHDPGDYDRAYPYEGNAKELSGKWLLIRDDGANSFHAQIGDGEMILQKDLRSLSAPAGKKLDMRTLVGRDFRKTDTYDPPSVIEIRYANQQFTANNISGGSSATLRFQANGPATDGLLAHVQRGGNFEYRIVNFEPFEYDASWQTFRSPPSKIAKQKLAEKQKAEQSLAAQQAAAKNKQDYADSLKPVSKLAFENCEQHGPSRKHYDCQCIAREIPGYFDAIVSDRVEAQEKRIAGFRKAIESNNNNPNLSEERKQQTRDGMNKRIAQSKAQIATLQNPSQWDESMQRQMVQSAQHDVYKSRECKVADGFLADTHEQCMRSSSLGTNTNKSKEEYCQCSAKQAGDSWLGSDRSMSSKVLTSINTQAFLACR